MSARILLVDDEPEWVKPQVMALRDAGFEVTLVWDPDEARAVLRSETNESFDLIILDLIMPTQGDSAGDENAHDFLETGVRLHREIREDLQLKMPILFMTVVRQPDIRRAIAEVEAKAVRRSPKFLTKPISSQEVVQAVKDALRG